MYGLDPEPGVTILRREFIRMSVGALGALLMAGRRPLWALQSDPKSISWDEFVKDLLPRAESVVAKRIEEEDYVKAVVETLTRVDRALIPAASELPKRKQFSIVELKIAKDRGFPYHDHRNYNGVIYVLQGSVKCRNFDIVGEPKAPPRGQKIRIRETASGLVKVGGSSTLTTTRDNIHDIRGGDEGARMLDIFTWMGPNARSHYLDVNPAPADAEKKIYEASFKG
jgi:hypothetical protein